MAQVARAMKVRGRRPEVLWLGCFHVDEPGATPQLGSFQMVVQAGTAAIALDRCKQRLRSLRATTSLFNRPCAIELLHIIKLDGAFTEPVLVNYVSADAPTPHAFIVSAMPEQPDRELKSYGPKEPDGGPVEDFLDFGAAAFRAALANAMAQSRAERARPAPSARAPRSRRRRT